MRSSRKTDKQKGREGNMGVTKREIHRTTKGIKGRKTGGVRNYDTRKDSPLPALNLVTLQRATAQNGSCIL